MPLVACGAVGSHSDAAASFRAMAKSSPFPRKSCRLKGTRRRPMSCAAKANTTPPSEGSKISVLQSGPRGLPPGLHRDHAELCIGVFLSQPNQINVLGQSSTLGILAIDLAAVFFTGGMDLSLRANMALSVIVGRGRAGGQGASAQREICSENTL